MKKPLKTVSIDTNILLAIFRREEKEGRYWPSRRIVEDAAAGKHIVVISSLSVFEVAERFMVEDKIDRMPRFWEWDGIEVVDVSRRISLEAVRIKVKCGMRRNQKVDSLLVATALVMEAEIFYTWDKDLIKKLSTCPYIYGTKLRVINPPRSLF